MFADGHWYSGVTFLSEWSYSTEHPIRDRHQLRQNLLRF